MNVRGEKQLSFNIPEIQSAHAILLLSDQYILQLRDEKSNIAAPGQWSLFGGLIQKGEKPLQAIRREIYEELSIIPSKFDYLWFVDYFGKFERRLIRSWFFISNVTSVWREYKLMEGKDLGIFRFDQVSGLTMPSVMRQAIERFHGQVKVIS